MWKSFKIILDQNPKTKWVSILLGSDEHALEHDIDNLEKQQEEASD